MISRLLKAFLVLLFVVAAIPAHAVDRKAVERQFQAWLKSDLWPAAKARGVSAGTFEKAFSGVKLNWKLPDLVPPGTRPQPSRPQAQAEFRSPAAYFNEKNANALVATGRKLLKKHERLIARIESRYGVPGPILLGIWAKETAFGRASIPHNAFAVLGTKAFMATRKELFREEVLAALEIVQSGDISPSRMKTSWAGAMGQPQFLPSSYLKYAVDFDGDGRRDIWNSVGDTLASIANYLNRFGWQAGRDWGFEASIPGNVSCAFEGPDQMRPIRDWAASGVERISGKPFPPHEREQPGALLFPAGRQGPVFVATPNFYVIKEYNNSDLYALSVGNLADRIAFSNKPFVANWQPVTGLVRGNVIAIQEKLVSLGYDVGGVDGLAGFKTRRAIGEWQQKNGLKATCFPSKSLASKF